MSVTNTKNQKLSTADKVKKIFSGECRKQDICMVKDILASFGDKWSMYTILLLGQHERLRFNELKGTIQGISQRMLTVTLRSLEEDGLVLRTHHPEIPPRVEYELTDLGKSLLEQLLQLAGWADEHFGKIVEARKQYAKEHGSK